MEHDYLYFWDKLGQNGERKLLGEVKIGENGLNMSFVIDGTKDSTKIVVWSYTISEAIKPNTIMWHENTDTWWCLADDKVDRIVNENGWLYIHNLKLEGGIELFNARDLTDCGFNQNTYTLVDFVNRLISLSSLEIPCNFYPNDNINSDKIIDYIKTYENYTLLSALREFFNGYNCSIKLRFYQQASSPNQITFCYLEVLPKNGNIERPIKDMDTLFNDVKEIKTINKNNYGTTVVSNAENIASTKSKLYPSVGFTRISGENYLIQPSDACIRLPSKANNVEYVEMQKGRISVAFGCNKVGYYDIYEQNRLIGTTSFDPTSLASFENAIEWLKSMIRNEAPANAWAQENLDEQFWEDAESQTALNTLLDYFTFRIYDVKNYDPLNNIFVSDKPLNNFFKSGYGNKPFVLGEKNLRNGVREANLVMYWERGSNLIKGFDFFNYHGVNNVIISADNQGVYFLQFSVTVATGTFNYSICFGDYELDADAFGYVKQARVQLSLLDTYFKVKYIPMSDIKIKYDNENDGKDIQLYNQIGKFVDGVALSKLLVSYKDEISSDNITKYTIGYSFYDMPQVGDIVVNGEDKYIINNVSVDLYINESGDTLGYFIVGEYTMSKNVATKSLLTNPNTNIRDYGIPQNYNVRRKQLYRDFYEFGYSSLSDTDSDTYMTLDKVLNVSNIPQNYVGHIGVIKMTFKQPYGGGGGTYDGGTMPPSDVWYYQLESTIYYLKKSMYEIIDFQDNNIIGYDCQNVTCGFDIRRIFEVIQVGSANIDIINTPISYVDNDGQVMGIDISMCSTTQITGIYEEYKEQQEEEYSLSYDKSLYNRCVFIPKEIYDKSLDNCDFEINEQYYNKDALEVPVFEYSCQLDDSNQVIVGENILETKENDLRYLYEIRFLMNGVCDNNTWKSLIFPSTITFQSNIFTINNTNFSTQKTCQIINFGQFLQVYAFDVYNVNKNNEEYTRTGQQSIKNMADSIASQQGYNGNCDIAIIRYTIPSDYAIENGVVTNAKVDLMFVCKKAQNGTYAGSNSSNLRIFVNHYKLK